MTQRLAHPRDTVVNRCMICWGSVAQTPRVLLSQSHETQMMDITTFTLKFEGKRNSFWSIHQDTQPFVRTHSYIRATHNARSTSVILVCCAACRTQRSNSFPETCSICHRCGSTTLSASMRQSVSMCGPTLHRRRSRSACLLSHCLPFRFCVDTTRYVSARLSHNNDTTDVV